MTEISIKSHGGDPITLQWGPNHGYKRVPGSITIVVGCVGSTHDVPCGSALRRGSIGVEFDICPDGSIQNRGCGIGDGNNYMHIVTGGETQPTAAQIAAIKARPFGASAGRDVIAWARGEAAAKIAERYND